MIVGALVAIIPFLGFPSSWGRFFELVCGVLIIGIAYRMAPKVKVIDSASLPYEDYKRSEPGIARDITNQKELETK